jgi:hypothetical protein
MFDTPRCEDFPFLAGGEGIVDFAPRDTLFALEWAAVAPGLGGWNVLLDDVKHCRLVSVVPPGSSTPTFIIFQRQGAAVMAWLGPGSHREIIELERFGDLRAAVLTLCPLHMDLLREVNESVELLCARTPHKR